MGLDLVELVMEIEDAFSVRISDAEASDMNTVGDVFDYIVAHTNITNSPSTDLSAASLETLCRSMAALGVDKILDPADLTNDILPQENRKQFWSDLQRTSALKLPPLRRPDVLVKVCSAVVIVVSVATGWLTYRDKNLESLSAVAA